MATGDGTLRLTRVQLAGRKPRQRPRVPKRHGRESRRSARSSADDGSPRPGRSPARRSVRRRRRRYRSCSVPGARSRWRSPTRASSAWARPRRVPRRRSPTDTLRFGMRLKLAATPLLARPWDQQSPELAALLLLGLYQLEYGRRSARMRRSARSWMRRSCSAQASRPASSTRCCAATSASATRCSRAPTRRWLTDRAPCMVGRTRSSATGAIAAAPAAGGRQRAAAAVAQRQPPPYDAGRPDGAARGRGPRGHATVRSPPTRSSSTCRWTCATCPSSPRGFVRFRMPRPSWRCRCSAPAAGERVLDACAAPGRQDLPPVGSGRRNCRRSSRSNPTAPGPPESRPISARLGLEASVRVADATRPEDWWDGVPFARILLDVPCSGTGVIRRHPDIKWLRRPKDIPTLATRQRRLLARAVAVARARRPPALCQLLGAARRKCRPHRRLSRRWPRGGGHDGIC